MAAEKKITDRDKIFAYRYIIDFKAEEAALEAGYSKSVARTKAFQWLAKDSKLYKPQLAEFIQELIKKREKRFEKTGDDVINELIKLGFSNISNLVDIKSGSVTVKDFDELTEDQQGCIESVAETKDGLRIKFYDKVKSLELLGKHYGVIRDKIDANIKKRLEIIRRDFGEELPIEEEE